MPQLRELPQATAKAVANGFERHEFTTHKTVARQGDACNALYVVYTGELTALANGERIASLGPGDYCGEQIFDVPDREADADDGDDTPAPVYAATYIATTDCVLLKLPQRTYLDVIDSQSPSS